MDYLARSERFELPTLGFEVRCSIQLSYERVPGLDYQTWPERASSLRPGPNAPKSAENWPQGGGFWTLPGMLNEFPTH
jgi:hypothetical protein